MKGTMSGREFREGLDMMAGKTSFTIDCGKATGIEPPSGNRRFMDCTIESIPLAPRVESREKSRLFLYFQRFPPFPHSYVDYGNHLVF